MMKITYMLHSWNKMCCALGAGILAAGLLAGVARGGTVAHWTFDEPNAEGVYPDTEGAHPATPKDKSAVRAYSGGTAKFKGAVSFTGAPGAYLTIPPITDIQKSSFTVAAWVIFKTPDPSFVIADWQSSQLAGFSFGIYPMGRDKTTAQPLAHLASAELVGGRGGNANNRRSVAMQTLANKTVPLGEWHHLVWTWDRDSASLITYMDGGMLEEYKRPDNSPNLSKSLDMAVNTQPMRIGSQVLALGTPPKESAFNGSMDELWIFDRALTRIEIRNLKNHNDIRGNVAVANVVTPTVSDHVATVATAVSATSQPVVEATENTAGTVLGAGTERLSPMRVAGVVMGLGVMVTMACYLIWAVKERAKMRAAVRA